MAKIRDNGGDDSAVLEQFIPMATSAASVPEATPTDILNELREAELCSSVEAHRAASAMLRSVLEKTLAANGYSKGTLQQKIDEAARDGIITESRKQRAHDEIRVLGNEVVHDAWRPVHIDEVEAAHRYAQRIIEDFYDDRPSVEAILKAKGRLR